MDKNKSIDGLKPRRSTKATSSKVSPKSTKAPSITAKTGKPIKTKSSKSNNAQAKSSRSTKPRRSDTPVIVPINTDATHAHKSAPSRSVNAPSRSNAIEDFLSPTQVFDFDSTSGELKASSAHTNTKSQSSTHKKKQKKPMSKKRKVIITIVIIFFLLIAAGAAGFIVWANSRLANMGIEGNIFDFITETYDPLKTDANGRTNILAFGTSGYDMEGNEGDGVHDGAQLTDSIMVISLDQNTGDVAMLSIPRDLKASPTCTATGKINEIYWCNNMDGTTEQAGAEALIAEISDILDIEIQYYVHVNWGSLVQIVDTLGGITVTVDEDIDDYYRYEAGGTYTMDGEEALWLARMRHGTAHGDFTRAASQQKILIGIKDKILDNGLDIPGLLSLFDTLSGNLKVNFTSNEIKTLAHLLVDTDIESIRQISLIDPIMLVTTGTINGISYVLPSAGIGNYAAIQDYVAKMLSNDPRVYEDYSILVLNATETPGLASSEQATLKNAGYDNIYIDDAPIGDYSEGYTLYSLTNTAPNTLRLLEEKYGTSQPADLLPTTIPTDYDFVLIINPSNPEQ